MDIWNILNNGFKEVNNIVSNYQIEINKEKEASKEMNNKKLKEQALHGYRFVQRVAAFEELKRRGYIKKKDIEE